MPSLTEFIQEIGNENITVQELHNSLITQDYKNGFTRVTFGTHGLMPNDLTDGKKTALIVWIDSERYNEALKKFKGD